MEVKPNDIVAWKSNKGNFLVDRFSGDNQVRQTCAAFGMTVSLPVLVITAEELEEKLKAAVFPVA